MRSTIAVILLSSLFSLIQANNGSALHIHTNGKKSTFRKLSIANKIPRGPLTARKPRRAKSQSRSQTITRTPTPGPAHASPSQLPSLNPSEPPSLKSYNKSKSATSSSTMQTKMSTLTDWVMHRSEVVWWCTQLKCSTRTRTRSIKPRSVEIVFTFSRRSRASKHTWTSKSCFVSNDHEIRDLITGTSFINHSYNNEESMINRTMFIR